MHRRSSQALERSPSGERQSRWGFGIGTEVDRVAANIDRLTKPRRYGRLLGYGLKGAVIYRNMNPATI